MTGENMIMVWETLFGFMSGIWTLITSVGLGLVGACVVVNLLITGVYGLIHRDENSNGK